MANGRRRTHDCIVNITRSGAAWHQNTKVKLNQKLFAHLHIIAANGIYDLAQSCLPHNLTPDSAGAAAVAAPYATASTDHAHSRTEFVHGHHHALPV